VQTAAVGFGIAAASVAVSCGESWCDANMKLERAPGRPAARNKTQHPTNGERAVDEDGVPSVKDETKQNTNRQDHTKLRLAALHQGLPPSVAVRSPFCEGDSHRPPG
jgi:hypothetical protein